MTMVFKSWLNISNHSSSLFAKNIAITADYIAENAIFAD